ncbi:IS66 family transposase [Magnetospira thiophila]
MLNAPESEPESGLSEADLPDDVEALKAIIRSQHVINTRLEKLVKAFKHALFGAKSERIARDQLELALEDIETGIAEVQAAGEASNTPSSKSTKKPRQTNRGNLPKHLERIEEVIKPDDVTCACCGTERHVIGEDVSERLDVIPAQFRVIITRRPKYACRVCEEGIVQAPAPARLIEGGLPTESLVAHVIVSKYADHAPLYRQAQIYARQGIDLDRSTLAGWVGKAAFVLKPVVDALLTDLKGSTKLFMDETPAPVLDPGRGKTKTGYFWALARDDRPWGGDDPPGVVFTYAPGRGGKHAEDILDGFGGILQVDGYTGYNRLIKPGRLDPAIWLAYCWAHARRKLYKLVKTGTSPIAGEGLKQIAALYKIEDEIRGRSPEDRLAVRQERSAPLVKAFETWIAEQRSRVSAKSLLGEALTYIAKHFEGLCRFLSDGRVEMDSNTVERTIRPITLNRKNALFAGHDAGAENWAAIASLIETCKLNGINPFAYIEHTLKAIVNGHKQNHIKDLLPWNYQAGV